MGHGMAKNLRQKLPVNCPVIVFDVNKEAVERFLQEHAGTKVTAASSPKEVAEVAVSTQRQNLAYLKLAGLTLSP